MCLIELGQVDFWYRQSPPPEYQLLRTRDIKYIEYSTGEKEFYDLRGGPDELLNTYEDLNIEQKNILQLQLDKMKNCTNENCRELEDNNIVINY